MACFLVPMALGIITGGMLLTRKFPKSWHLNWLNTMLWGGSFMLAVEHLAHEEIVPYFPFLTKGIAEVFPEMMAVGGPMTLAIIGIWVGMLFIAPKMAIRKQSITITA